MVNIIGKKNTEPEVRCIKLKPTSWQSQFKEFESNLQNKNMTIIVSVRDLILQDPIAAKNALQKLSSLCKLSDVYQLAALSREMVLITPYKITMAGE